MKKGKSKKSSKRKDERLEKSNDTIKELMSYPKCRSVKVINNPARPGSNQREVNCVCVCVYIYIYINKELKRSLRCEINVRIKQ
jgi:hypothetical protein